VYSRAGTGYADKNPDWYLPYIEARLGGAFIRQIKHINGFTSQVVATHTEVLPYVNRTGNDYFIEREHDSEVIFWCTRGYREKRFAFNANLGQALVPPVLLWYPDRVKQVEYYEASPFRPTDVYRSEVPTIMGVAPHEVCNAHSTPASWSPGLYQRCAPLVCPRLLLACPDDAPAVSG
jgi:hypothetical protein